MQTVILIPAYNPDGRLLTLVQQLRSISSYPVIVINDGSRPECLALFHILGAEYDCAIFRHMTNLGKGAALKTGLQQILRRYPDCLGIVTADADGQQTPEDILRVAHALEAEPDSLILGTRDFSGSQVPFKSRWGNRITSGVFRMNTGRTCPDTQTGLRGIPAGLARKGLEISGERFEYEMNFLLALARQGVTFREMPIQTVYMEKNRSSHFHPLWDSLRIYLNILRFGLSSLLCAGLDITLFTLFAQGLFGTETNGLMAATAIARVLSGILNYVINRKWVFKSGGSAGRESVKYLALFLGQMALSGFMVGRLSEFFSKVTLLKIAVDSLLFVISYFLQKNIIFRRNGRVHREKMV